MMKYKRVSVDGRGIFYREAGNAEMPALLLLHGFPTSSHMFRDLMPRLADRYHVVAPDLPGFGFSDTPSHAGFKYTFDNPGARQRLLPPMTRETAGAFSGDL